MVDGSDAPSEGSKLLGNDGQLTASEVGTRVDEDSLFDQVLGFQTVNKIQRGSRARDDILPKSQPSDPPQNKSDNHGAGGSAEKAEAAPVNRQGQSQDQRRPGNEESQREKAADRTDSHAPGGIAAAGKEESKAPAKDASPGGSAPVKSQGEDPYHHSQGASDRSDGGIAAPAKAEAAAPAKVAGPERDLAVKRPQEFQTQGPAEAENRVAGGTASVSKVEVKAPANDPGSIGLSPAKGHSDIPAADSRGAAHTGTGPAPVGKAEAPLPAKEAGPAVTAGTRAESQTPYRQSLSAQAHDRQTGAAPAEQSLSRIAADSQGRKQPSSPDSGVRQLTSHDLRLLQKAISSPMPDAIVASNKDVPVGPSKVPESGRALPAPPAVETAKTSVTGRVIGAAKDPLTGLEADGRLPLPGRSDSVEKPAEPPSANQRLDVAGKRAYGLGQSGDIPGGAKPAGSRGDAAPGAAGKGGRIVDPPILSPASVKAGEISSSGKGSKDGTADSRPGKEGKGNDSKGGRTGEPPIFLPPGLVRVGRFFPPDKEPTARGNKDGRPMDKGLRTADAAGRNADVGSQRATGREPAAAAGKSAQSDPSDSRSSKDGKAKDSKGERPPGTPVVLPPGGIRIGNILPPGRDAGGKAAQAEPVSRQPAAEGGSGGRAGKTGDDRKTAGLKPDAKEVPVDKHGRPNDANADRFAGLPIVQGPSLPWLGVRVADVGSPQPPESGRRGAIPSEQATPVTRPEAKLPPNDDVAGRGAGVPAQDSMPVAAQGSEKAAAGASGQSLEATAGAVGEKAPPVKMFRLPDLLITGPISKPKFRRVGRNLAAQVEESSSAPAEAGQPEKEPVAQTVDDTRGKLLGYDYSLLEHQDENREPMPGANYVVEPGDTLESIAARVFADSLIALLLLEMNKESVPTALADGRLVIDLKPGVVLRLPTLSRVRQFRERLASSTASIFDYVAHPPEEHGQSE